MEISRQADYAVRAVLELAKRQDEELIRTGEIAANQVIPAKYLPSIIRTLARAGIIRTFRGSQGGISLAYPPKQISLRDVVEAIDGPIILNRCESQPGECLVGDEGVCSMHRFWVNITADIQEELDSINFADLAGSELVEYQ